MTKAGFRLRTFLLTAILLAVIWSFPLFSSDKRELEDCLRGLALLSKFPFFHREVESGSGFNVGGINSSRTIEGLQTLAGLSKEDLDQQSTDHSRRDVQYRGLQTLLKDGDTVRQALLRFNSEANVLQVTHQQVAAPLLKAVAIAESEMNSKDGFDINMEVLQSSMMGKNHCDYRPNPGISFQYGAKKYSVQIALMTDSAPNLSSAGKKVNLFSGAVEHENYKPFQGIDLSIPNGRPTHIPVCIQVGGKKLIGANYFIKITSEDGSTLEIDALTPHLIHQFGFYQSGSYATSLENIVHFFQLTK